MESTNIVITAPGVTHSHQLFLITSADFAALIIFPQVGISEGTPTPKKLKPASLKINPATLIDKETITGDKAFLKILLKIMTYVLLFFMDLLVLVRPLYRIF